jgi:hypothetical protein
MLSHGRTARRDTPIGWSIVARGLAISLGADSAAPRRQRSRSRFRSSLAYRVNAGSAVLTGRFRRYWPALPLLCIAIAAGDRLAAADSERGADFWMTAAYERKASDDLGGAIEALEAARQAGADPQRVELELAYARLAMGETAAARDALSAAARGPDAELARRARAELDALPSRWWVDLYAESFGWHRADGADSTTDLVPTVRARAFRRLSFAPDVNVYLFAQATRDTASRGAGAGAPTIHSDNSALVGAGFLVRLWRSRVGLFGQAGPAVSLIDDGTDAVDFDARGGAYLGIESAACGPGPRPRASICSDVYAEAVYTSRFDNDVSALARGRQSLRYLATGPLGWEIFWELRGSADRNGDYYDNFVDAGAGPRWRVLGRVPLDLQAGVHAGRYFGRDNVDPAPDKLHYVDLRILATTYLEF